MGYACPVCDIPQRDQDHLADHLAFSALLGREDHERWLDERVPGWGEIGRESLGDRAAEHAPERELPQVFEDTTDEHRRGRDHRHGERAERRARGRGAGIDPETESILAEARELTRGMVESDPREGEGGEGEEGEANRDETE